MLALRTRLDTPSRYLALAGKPVIIVNNIITVINAGGGTVVLTFLEISLDYQLILLSIPATDDQVVFAAHKPVELLEPVRLANMLDGRLGAHLAELLLSLLLRGLEGFFIGVDSLLLFDHVLLALLIVGSGIGISVEVQVQLHLSAGRRTLMTS